jgi:hypothetical protein
MLGRLHRALRWLRRALGRLHRALGRFEYALAHDLEAVADRLPVEARAITLVASGADLLDLHHERVAIAIHKDLFDELDVA